MMAVALEFIKLCMMSLDEAIKFRENVQLGADTLDIDQQATAVITSLWPSSEVSVTRPTSAGF